MLVKTLIIVLMTSLSLSCAFSKEDKVFTFPKQAHIISNEGLAQAFEKDRLDGVVEAFAGAIEVFKTEYGKAEANSLGVRVKDEIGKQMLDRIVYAARRITVKYDPGKLHYYVYAQLYKDFPMDVNLAIERSPLTPEVRDFMRESLKNNLN